MSLTKAECLIAAQRARTWPKGMEGHWIRGLKISYTTDAAAHLRYRPESEPFG